MTSLHPDTLSAAAPLLWAFGAVQLIVGDTQRLPYPRAACAARAQAPIVAFTEDHAFVEPHWAPSLLHVFAADQRIMAVAAARHRGVSTGEALEVEGTLQRQLREVRADACFVTTEDRALLVP